MFLRTWSLIVSDGALGEDLSALRIVFKTSQSDTQTLNSATIRVYNLAPKTANKIEKQYTSVFLQCGYQDGPPLARVFQGTIKQVRKGRENAIDSYVDILAADGDIAYNQTLMNQTLAAGSTIQQRRDVIVGAMNEHGTSTGYSAEMTGGVLPRGKVLYGMARDYMEQISKTSSVTWSIQNGQVQILTRKGYLPGEAVVLGPATGLIGVPEQTEQGVTVRCLLNPLIQIGGRVKIESGDISQTVNKTGSPQAYNQTTGIQNLATIPGSGLYRVLVVEHEGDTRGVPWYSDLVCLALDPSAPAGGQVQG